jgi:hypothetical protein
VFGRREAANQIRAAARPAFAGRWRLHFLQRYPGRHARRLAFALGYYRPPRWGFQYAAPVFANSYDPAGRGQLRSLAPMVFNDKRIRFVAVQIQIAKDVKANKK